MVIFTAALWSTFLHVSNIEIVAIIIFYLYEWELIFHYRMHAIRRSAAGMASYSGSYAPGLFKYSSGCIRSKSMFYVLIVLFEKFQNACVLVFYVIHEWPRVISVCIFGKLVLSVIRECWRNFFLNVLQQIRQCK